MDIESLAIGAPFYMILLIVLVASLYPAAVALDRGRVRFAVIVGVAGIAVHGLFIAAVSRFVHGYDGMALLLVWPIAAIVLSAVIALIIGKAAKPRA